MSAVLYSLEFVQSLHHLYLVHNELLAGRILLVYLGNQVGGVLGAVLHSGGGGLADFLPEFHYPLVILYCPEITLYLGHLLLHLKIGVEEEGLAHRIDLLLRIIHYLLAVAQAAG